MYRIISDGTTIATVDKLQFWKQQRNGIRINCAENVANGIIVNDQFYRLPWMPKAGDEQDVTYEEFSGSDKIEESQNEVADLAEFAAEVEYQNALNDLGMGV